MKKYIFLIVLLFLIVYIAGRSMNKITVLRVGTEGDYPPNNWEEDKSTDSNVPIENKKGFYVEGYDIQIAKHVAEQIGAKLEVKKIAWQDLIPALKRREIDAIFSGMLDTDARKKEIAFSNTYDFQETEYAIMVYKNGKYASAKKLSDFYGAVITGQKGTLFDDAVEQIPGAIHVEAADTFTEMIDKLENHDIDGVVIDLDSGLIHERSYPSLMLVRFSEGDGFKFNFTGTCAGVRKNDAKLLNEINSVINGLSKRDRQRIMDRTIARQWENINF